MFRGSAPAKVDDKGRLKIPTDFRRVLKERFGAEVFVTSIHGDSALVYPLPVWEEIEARLAALPSSNPTKRRFLQRINFFGQQGKQDAQGRVLLPQLLREKAGLVGEVVVSAQLDHLVVWGRDEIERRLEEEPFSEEDFLALTEHGV
ncbi:MAG: division/cell wall cluster transcriptional repressor MraZ [Deltaproteobacteria bacterium]|nr:division/cell wall cluster transcriptional repressor MraZ [Deltaproteobacteria bacterium]